MNIETAQVNSSATPSATATAPKITNPSTSFQDLLSGLSASDITIKKTPSEADIKAKEQERKMEVLLDLMEKLMGEKPVIAKDDVVDISGENTGSMSVTLSDAGFERLRQSLEGNTKISDKSTVTVSPTLIQISSKPATASVPSVVAVTPKVIQPSASIPQSKRVDPIVITIGKASASLRGDNIDFDIDGNGTNENMAVLGQNDYLLSLDKSKNGIIDNGRELFGPSSGNGFLELGFLDSNHDNKIDNSDMNFNNLRLLEFSSTKQQFLHTLSSKGVESIYLSTSKTITQLSDENGNLRAEITEKGTVKLGNNSAGVVQHLDFFT